MYKNIICTLLTLMMFLVSANASDRFCQLFPSTFAGAVEHLAIIHQTSYSGFNAAQRADGERFYRSISAQSEAELPFNIKPLVCYMANTKVHQFNFSEGLESILSNVAARERGEFYAGLWDCIPVTTPPTNTYYELFVRVFNALPQDQQNLNTLNEIKSLHSSHLRPMPANPRLRDGSAYWDKIREELGYERAFSLQRIRDIYALNEGSILGEATVPGGYPSAAYESSWQENLKDCAREIGQGVVVFMCCPCLCVYLGLQLILGQWVPR